jgi:hypothetical protein
MADELRNARRAIEDHGYKFYRYRFHTDPPGLPVVDADDPEEGMARLIEEMRDYPGHFNIDMRGDIFANLFDRGTEDDMEDAVNWLYRQVRARVDMGEQEEPERHPLNREVDIVYRIDTRGDYFELYNYDGEKGRKFVAEVEEILEDEGYRIKTL